MGRSPGEGNGNPLLYSCLENSHGQRSLGGCKESNMTERLNHHHQTSSTLMCGFLKGSWLFCQHHCEKQKRYQAFENREHPLNSNDLELLEECGKTSANGRVEVL